MENPAARISVVIPTTGRDTFEAARASAAGADEIVVVEDATGDRGYTARMRGMAQATGTHLAFLDDDDIYLPGALDLMREAACERPVIFRMDDPLHGIIWRDPVLRYCNVGTPMLLVPNDPARLGVWAPYANSRGGDFTFITGCAERMGAPLWREEIIARVRPHERGPTISIVTPWLDHPELRDDYDAAIRAGAPDELIVVDNGSRPPLGLPGIRLEENAGFSRASNLGLAAARSDAVLFLNNDIWMTRPDWLTRLGSALEPGVLVGPRLRNDAHTAVDGERIPYLDGWCLAGMRDDLAELGGFDDEYREPAYYSDNDLCLRARAAGMSLREVQIGLRHKGNATVGPGADVSAAAGPNYERYAALARDLIGVPA